MKTLLLTIAASAVLFLIPLGQAADVAILNGDVSLTISAATAGQQPASVNDETGQLEWTTLEVDPVKKIIVQTSLAGPSYNLTIRAIGISSGDGTSAGEVSLSTTPAELIGDIPSGILLADPGTCTLSYTASAIVGGGTGSDNHTVTFTIMDQ
ncbi:hypothetical protein KKH27_01935 [bacterium]|nr:hypothetical protein [bacterium]MBU1985339.1 hypothetical protein [bacterium]